ncbi:Hint domain containing protein [uncultured Caudovirales phage]|uniref:Hint domain containing protein n=1 Tax=uncultured Caudovirales phage TaxID=2100421 RepID=A0A6J5PHL9_9CAUD|nr:Hint domain containing protein [uncultured Caudovirales phage]CAB4210328.1 Hint domain containing protein [uncultured Caudovirales phage]
MSMILSLDFETASPRDLTKIGAYKYAKSAKIMCAGYAIYEENTFEPAMVKAWRAWAGEPMPADLLAALADPDVRLFAWNAQFERLITQHAAGIAVPLEKWHCTAARARASAYPGKLDLCAKALGIPQKKDLSGGKLMKKLSSEGSGTPEEYERVLEYCMQDVVVEATIGMVVRDLTPDEWQDYWVCERMNDRGIPVDIELARAAQSYAQVEAAEIAAELKNVTKGAVTSAKEFKRIKAWLLEQAPDLVTLLTGEDGKVSLDKSARITALESGLDLPRDVEDLLHLIDDAGRASTAKYAAIENRTDEDGRLRGAYLFNGAGQTGRFCVDGATLVDTPRGPRAIKDLRPGHEVWTHNGRWRQVMNLWYKGEEPMYRLTFSTGAWVICTAGHRLLTDRGWQHVCELEGFGAAGGNHLPAVHVAAVQNNDADWRRVGGHIPHDIGGAAPGADGGTDTQAISREQITGEDGESEPHVRASAVKRAYPARGVPRGMGWPDACVVTSAGISARVGTIDATPRATGASYRRGQDEQHAGQLGAGDAERALSASRPTLEKVEAVGSRGVWDIEVAEDHSYAAQGLIHHNSAMGFQPHNLVRDKLENANRVISAVLDGSTANEVTALSGVNILTTLARLLRPTIVAENGNVLVWADYAAVEARALPWLADNVAAKGLLDLFRKGEDVYKYTASDIYRVPVDRVDKEQRQMGKIAVLALGYQGGKNAFRKMARAYGLKIDDDTAEKIKLSWRHVNPWAKKFWSDLEAAAICAVRKAGTIHAAGRVKYMFHGDMLYALLPCGRLIAYPEPRLDAVDGKFGPQMQLTALKASLHPKKGETAWPRVALYGGLLAENATQGFCASLLRSAARRLDDAGWPVVMHTHDEMLVEVAEDEVDDAKIALQAAMLRNQWPELPLAAEPQHGYSYDK